MDSDQLADSAVEEQKIKGLAVSTSKLAVNAVTEPKIAVDSVVNGKIKDGAVSYAKTGFTGTLDQVGTNKSNIETLFGYFTGSASFSYLQCSVFALGGSIVTTGSFIDGNGNTRSGFLHI